jgi:hypothetical protein
MTKARTSAALWPGWPGSRGGRIADGADIVLPVQSCPDCGNHGLSVRLVDGVSVRECELCGARFGERQAVAALGDRDEAKARGIDGDVWPLVRTLSALPGIVVRRSMGVSSPPPTLPFVEVALGTADGLLQLENLAKSLRLAAGTLQLHWQLVVEFQQNLLFVLKPHHPGGPVTAAEAQAAAADVDRLARQIGRDQRLSWWRHATATGER